MRLDSHTILASKTASEVAVTALVNHSTGVTKSPSPSAVMLRQPSYYEFICF